MPLPENPPNWYTVDKTKEKGWTPKTEDIIEGGRVSDTVNAWNEEDITEGGRVSDVVNAWNEEGCYKPTKPASTYTVRLDKLQILSPIQVGGAKFPEGGILPAQIGGLPCIPGSSVRGALLSWIQSKWQDIPSEEQAFWQSLLASDRSHWLPRTIRFESILLKNLRPFPLNPQQEWQLFDCKPKPSIQWQVSPKLPTIVDKFCSQVLLKNSANKDNFCLQVLLKNSATHEQKRWLETRLKEMLEYLGIGRGKASGFGRLATFFPDSNWEIRLTGMKPSVQKGEYRWSPQVLRACLRGYFTRLALSLFSDKQHALKLTEKIFGGLGCPAQLTLTSYLSQREGYTNIPAQDETWVIRASCDREFQPLIDALLSLASRLGGLGPGWRRPPHVLERFNGFRGSQFTVNSANSAESLAELINRLREMIRQLAQTYKLRPLSTPKVVAGGLITIWQGEVEQWWDIVHGVCSTTATNRPNWCGNSESRPSGYAVREHEDYCLITVFDQAVEETLRKQGFQRVWRC